MVGFGFKPNPKAQVGLKFAELFGKEYKPEVRGGRITQAAARERGLRCGTRDGLYLAELLVEGEVIAAASHPDWRKAYKALVLEVEKLFADGVALA